MERVNHKREGCCWLQGYFGTWEPAAGECEVGARLSPLLIPETLLEAEQATCPGDSSCQSATLAALLCFSAILFGPCTEGG